MFPFLLQGDQLLLLLLDQLLHPPPQMLIRIHQVTVPCLVPARFYRTRKTSTGQIWMLQRRNPNSVCLEKSLIPNSLVSFRPRRFTYYESLCFPHVLDILLDLVHLPVDLLSNHQEGGHAISTCLLLTLQRFHLDLNVLA